MVRPYEDLTRITLKVLFIGSLLVGSFWIIQPFLPAIIWAMTLVVATWPLMLWVQRHAGNRRGIAVLVMTLILLLVVIVPLGLAVSTIVTNLDEIGGLVRTISSLRAPPPPDWLAGVPLIGERVVLVWGKLTASGLREVTPSLAPYAGAVTEWIASSAGSLGRLVIHFLLTTAIAAVMYACCV